MASTRLELAISRVNVNKTQYNKGVKRRRYWIHFSYNVFCAFDLIKLFYVLENRIDSFIYIKTRNSELKTKFSLLKLRTHQHSQHAKANPWLDIIKYDI